MKKVQVGLDVLMADVHLQKTFRGTVALLAHNASVDASLIHASTRFKELFGDRFIKLFGPQHGFATDAQDNMVESDHMMHPFFNIPVYSLYSETRVPTDEMLDGIDHLFVDLQDVGCRMYTYIYTLTLILEKCSNKAIEIIVLDRPNPLNGVDLEGNILDLNYASFIGRHPLPVRHGLTIAEVALMHQAFWVKDRANLKVIKMRHWERPMYFNDTQRPWLLPSPNLGRSESALTFPAMVLFEGTKLSEGRGTTQALEIIGHPKLDALSFYNQHLAVRIKESKLEGFALRPITFLPTFQKHKDQVCGGLQLHITDRKTYQPWRVGQFLLREVFQYMGDDFEWLSPPYEYNYTQHPIDIINGTDVLRHWVTKNNSIEALDTLEDLKDYKQQLKDIIIY